MTALETLTTIPELDVPHYLLTFNEKNDVLDPLKFAELVEYARITGTLTLAMDWLTQAGIDMAFKILRKAHALRKDKKTPMLLGLTCSPWMDAPWTTNGYSRIVDGKRQTDPVNDNGSLKEQGYMSDFSYRLGTIKLIMDANNAIVEDQGCDCCIVALGACYLDSELWYRSKTAWTDPKTAADCAAQYNKHMLIQDAVEAVFSGTQVNYGLYGSNTSDTKQQNKAVNPYFPPTVDPVKFNHASPVCYGCDTGEMASMIMEVPLGTKRSPTISLDIAVDPEGAFIAYPTPVAVQSSYCTAVGSLLKTIVVDGVFVYHQPYDPDCKIENWPEVFPQHLGAYSVGWTG